MSYFHPQMNEWSSAEQAQARCIDPVAWRPFAPGDTNDFKNAMGRRRQQSLELARRYPGDNLLVVDEEPLRIHKKGKTTMKQSNHSLAVFLINRDVRGIACTYALGADGKPEGKRYIFKSFDKTLKAGDAVVVPHLGDKTFTVVYVAEVDVEPDFDTSHDYKWIVDRIDTADYEATIKKEEESIVLIKRAEKLAARKELRKKVLDLAETDVKALPLYKNGDDDVLAGEALQQRIVSEK